MMKQFKVISIFIIFLFSANSAFSACTSKYDFASGNYYTVCDNGSSTSITGSNITNGTNWSQTQNSDGSCSGRDKNNNYYSGDNNTGRYYNYGTGKTCFGTGALRTCY